MDKYFAPDNAELVITFGKGGGRIGKNSQIPFTITLKDGKPGAVSPADVKATVTGPARAVAQTRGAANRYTVTITTETPGLYTAEVTVRDQYKAKGTFQVYSNTSPANTIIEGGKQATSNPHLVHVKMVDDKGVPLTLALGDAINVGVKANEGSFGAITSKDNDDGTFTISVEVKKKGQSIELVCQVNGVDTGVPFSFAT